MHQGKGIFLVCRIGILQQRHGSAEIKTYFPGFWVDVQRDTFQNRDQMGLRQQLSFDVAGKGVKGLLQELCRLEIWIGKAPLLPELFSQKTFQCRHSAGIDIAAPAGRRHICHPGPGVDKLFEQRLPHCGIAFSGKTLDQRFQSTARIPRHGLVQAVHIAKGHNIRQGGNLLRHLDQIGGQAAGRILVEPHVDHLAAGAIGEGEAACLQMLVAACINQALGCVAGVQALDAQTFKSKQLIRPGLAIAVDIAPDAQRGEHLVADVDEAVFVGVPLRQGGKTVGRLLAACKQGVVAEQFRTVIDTAVTISVPNQKPVIRRYPAGELGKTVGVMVEEHARIFAQGLDPITVQIEDQRGSGLFGSTEQVVQGFSQAIIMFILLLGRNKVIQSIIYRILYMLRSIFKFFFHFFC